MSPEDTNNLDRQTKIRTLVDGFLIERALNPELSSADLIASHPDLMPELEQSLRLVSVIDAARVDADQMQQATLETRVYAGPPTAFPGLHVRCPHCFLQIKIDLEAQIERIHCHACGNAFGLADDHSEAPRTIGNFEFVKRLGAGSFGTVWKARDKELDRLVAIKVPRHGKLDAKEVEQFIREARVAAQLNHSGIVKVYEVGKDGESVYIVSDLVEGVPLSSWTPQHGLSCQEAAELCAKICDALHHAHEESVVHRDLKPANIMMDADGIPYITDFGLAKQHANDVTITADGHILGTPAYMSPEQAKGEAYRLDRRADIYSLGVMLFELLTGERPFRGDVTRLIEKVIKQEPPRLRDLRRSVPRDLETICLKCLEKEPERRYETAAALATDLRLWINGEPIQARPVSRSERLRRWCWRNPISSAIVATAMLTLLLTTVAAISINRTRASGHALAVQALYDYRDRDSTELRVLRNRVSKAADILRKSQLNLDEAAACQKFVAEMYEKFGNASREFGQRPFASWYLLDHSGSALAVFPAPANLRGFDFHERDYFIGALENPGEVYSSQPFQSKNDGLYKFALTIFIPEINDNDGIVLAASVATDATRAIRREEVLVRLMTRWIAVALTPTIGLLVFVLAIIWVRRSAQRKAAQSG